MTSWETTSTVLKSGGEPRLSQKFQTRRQGQRCTNRHFLANLPALEAGAWCWASVGGHDVPPGAQWFDGRWVGSPLVGCPGGPGGIGGRSKVGVGSSGCKKTLETAVRSEYLSRVNVVDGGADMRRMRNEGTNTSEIQVLPGASSDTPRLSSRILRWLRA